MARLDVAFLEAVLANDSSLACVGDGGHLPLVDLAAAYLLASLLVEADCDEPLKLADGAGEVEALLKRCHVDAAAGKG